MCGVGTDVDGLCKSRTITLLSSSPRLTVLLLLCDVSGGLRWGLDLDLDVDVDNCYILNF